MGLAAAAVGAAGSIAGAGIGAMGASSAAKTQANAATQAANVQANMFNTIRSDLSPYRAAGTAALPAVYQLLGLSAPAVDTSTVNLMGSPGAGNSTVLSDTQAQQLLNDRPDVLAAYQTASATADKNSPAYAQAGLDNPLNYARHWYSNMGGSAQYQVPGLGGASGGTSASPLTGGSGSSIEDFLSQTPGYQFQMQQGTQAVNNALTARGLGGLSGSLGKGLAKYVTGLADSTYQQQLGNYMNLVGVGQSAANQTGAYGTQAANNAGTALTNAGTAAAGGQVGVASALSGGINGASNAYLTSKLLGSGMYGGYGTQGTMADASPAVQSAMSGVY